MYYIVEQEIDQRFLSKYFCKQYLDDDFEDKIILFKIFTTILKISIIFFKTLQQLSKYDTYIFLNSIKFQFKQCHISMFIHFCCLLSVTGSQQVTSVDI